MKRNINFLKNWTLVITALLISLVIVAPISQSLIIKNEDSNKTGVLSEDDFSITIHRIKEIDEIDPWPHGEVDWQLRMYVNDMIQIYECVGDDVLVDQTFVWPGVIIQNDLVYIKMELMDRDPWPDTGDIADISACADPDYQEGDYDDTTNFYDHRPAVFKRTYNVDSMQWQPVDESNDYLNIEYQSLITWYITSGDYDGSTTVDENDATIWFNVSFGNTPPYPPARPTGPISGWQGMIYDFSTSSFDPDSDQIQFGWDWNGDGEIDELTGFYDSWETATSSHVWTQGQLYYIKAMAIDSRGLPGQWSETLKVRINAEGGINGVEVEEWSLGHIYSFYFDHEKTQEILDTIRQGGDIVTAVSAVISAIAAACGIPIPYAFIFPIVAAIMRLGAEVIGMMDRGMGIYVRAYVWELYGVPTGGFAYIWSQTAEGAEGAAPGDNQAPAKPEKPSGPRYILPGKEHSFSSVTTDPEGNRITYIFDWDGDFSCSDLKDSGEKITMSHTWENSGTYSVRVKTLDEYGFESEWSDPFTVKVMKDRSASRIISGSYLMELLQHFRILNRLFQTFS